MKSNWLIYRVLLLIISILMVNNFVYAVGDSSKLKKVDSKFLNDVQNQVSELEVLRNKTENKTDDNSKNEIDPTQFLTRTETDLKIHKQDILNRMSQIGDQIRNAALKTPYVDASQKVYDFAGLLTPDEENKLRNLAYSARDKYGVDVCIVTIYNNDPNRNTLDYIRDFFDYNDFGVGEAHDGFAIIINMYNRRCEWRCTGKPHWEGILESFNDEYMEEIVPPLRNGEYYLAFDYIINDFLSDYAYVTSFPIYKCLLFAFLLTLTIILIAKQKHKNRFVATQAQNYIVKDSFNLTLKNDCFIRTNRTQTYSPRDTGSSGSSGGGSSSGTSDSSGGVSF